MRLAIVVPCYNEAAVIQQTAAKLDALVARLVAAGKCSADSGIYIVDDGSRDESWALIKALSTSLARVHGIRLSRNRGHQTAVLAGLENAPGDAVISIDADLQDDLAAIESMLDEHARGAEVVYGVRRSRTSDTGFKRATAQGYYRFLALLGVEIVFNHADYRLLGRRALDALAGYTESNLFLRGIVPQLGFRSAKVFYDRSERLAGESKYPLHKMLALAWNGVTSFSAAPLRIITAAGTLISMVSIATAIWAVALKLFTDRAVPGWASTVVPLYFLGGVQLLAIGVVGEYQAKIYLETKRRPKYFIDETAGEHWRDSPRTARHGSASD